MNCRRLLIFLPCGAGDVAPHNSFDWEDFELANLHRTVAQSGSLRFRNRRWKIKGDEMGTEAWNQGRENRKPVAGEEGKQRALGWDALKHSLVIGFYIHKMG